MITKAPPMTQAPPYTYGDTVMRVETGMPGAVVESVELSEGVIAELNGAGSVIALLYPHGLED